jgi:hypothetical protein
MGDGALVGVYTVMHALLIERTGVVNTGDAGGPRTADCDGLLA